MRPTASNLIRIAATRLSTAALATAVVTGATLGTSDLASAQTMPNSGAWLQQMVGMQQRLQVQGDNAVRQIFWKCIIMSRLLRARRIDPGNCGATPASASAAIGRLSATYQQSIQNTQDNMNRTWQANDDYDHRAIQNCTKVYNQDTGYMQWSCPNGSSNTLTGQ